MCDKEIVVCAAIWVQDHKIGRRNNQHFVSIPHSKLIDKSRQ